MGRFKLILALSILLLVTRHSNAIAGGLEGLFKDRHGVGIYNVAIAIKDSSGKLIATTITNDYGIFHFSSLSQGKYSIEYYYDHEKQVVDIIVPSDSTYMQVMTWYSTSIISYKSPGSSHYTSSEQIMHM